MLSSEKLVDPAEICIPVNLFINKYVYLIQISEDMILYSIRLEELNLYIKVLAPVLFRQFLYGNLQYIVNLIYISI